MPESTNRVRHAVSRSTGATTWTRKDGDGWTTTCLNHGSETTAAAREAAWKNGSTPANFCPKCKAIVAGKADKLAVGLLDLPTGNRGEGARAEEDDYPDLWSEEDCFDQDDLTRG